MTTRDEMYEAANSRQVGGDHYKTGGEEHWDRVARLRLDYFQGQITKYTERWYKKNGIQDLLKARHFLDKYIELVEAGYQHPEAKGDNGSKRVSKTGTDNDGGSRGDSSKSL